LTGGRDRRFARRSSSARGQHLRERFAVDDLVPEAEAQHLRDGLFAHPVAVAAGVFRPQPVMRIDGATVFLGPLGIERLDPAVRGERAIVGFADRPKVRADSVVEDAGHRARGPSVIAHQVTRARHDPIAVAVRLAVGRAEERPPLGKVLILVPGRVIRRRASTREHVRSRGSQRFPVGAEDVDR
jgi:hypothetical protein